MKRLVLYLLIFPLWNFWSVQAQGLNVYDPVPGLAPSEHYSFQIRETGGGEWRSPFAFITRCVPSNEVNDATMYYSRFIGDWSNTFINFEIEEWTEVEIEITKLGGGAITEVEVLPPDQVRRVSIRDGKAYVVIDRPAMFTVDINGQMDQPTGRLSPEGWMEDDFYAGPPIHTLTVFANPVLVNKPQPDGERVLYVEPGGALPANDGTWDTLYFSPGVHDIGTNNLIFENRSYYIPGDAVVHGTFNNMAEPFRGANIRIFGHGVISGERFTHPKDQDPVVPAERYFEYRPIQILGASDTVVEGVTIIDPAMHALLMSSAFNPDAPTKTRWVKVFSWRGNGDGTHAFQNGLIEDCFFRTADDSIYVGGIAIRRCQFWNDVNGSAFVFSNVGRIENPEVLVEDCDVLYSRSVFMGGDTSYGGGIFNLRGEGEGEEDSAVTIRNIRVWERYMNRAAFLMQSAFIHSSDPLRNQIRGPGDLIGIRFENISIPGTSILGYPETLTGTADAKLRDFVFDNVSFGGVVLDDPAFFMTNEYVSGLQFESPVEQDNRFNNGAGDGAWENAQNWSLAEAPRPLDNVRHESVAGNLLVNSTAYAGSLSVSHAGTASVQFLPGARMEVAGDVVMGGAGLNGVGHLQLDGGDLQVGGEFRLGLFGSDRLGICDLNNGSITVHGPSTLGGLNNVEGRMNVNGGYLFQRNSNLNIGSSGTGILNVDGGFIEIDGTGSLVIGRPDSSGDGLVTIVSGQVITPTVLMENANFSDAGAATINLLGGTLQVEGSYLGAMQLYDDAHLYLEEGLLLWKGNLVSKIQEFVDEGRISIAGGVPNRFNATPEFQWKSGNSILCVDFNEVHPGYTTVWVTQSPLTLTQSRAVASGSYSRIEDMSFNLSVFGGIFRYASLAGQLPAEEAIDATVPGQVLDYRFASADSVNNFQSTLTSGGLSSEQTALGHPVENYVGSRLYTDTDPLADWSNPHDYGQGGTIGPEAGVRAIATNSEVSGTVDISGLDKGTLYFIYAPATKYSNPQIEVSLSDGVETVSSVVVQAPDKHITWWVSGVDINNSASLQSLSYSMSVSNPTLWLGTVLVAEPAGAPMLLGIEDEATAAGVDVYQPITFSVDFSKRMDPYTVETVDFSNAGDAAITVLSVDPVSPGVFRVTVLPTSTGELRLQLNAGAMLTDSFGEPLDTGLAFVDDTLISVNADHTSPLLISRNFSGDLGGGSVTVGSTITYSLQFSETMDVSTVQSMDFRNAGSADVTIGEPVAGGIGAFSLPVVVNSLGTVEMEVGPDADLRDMSGNALLTSPSISSCNNYSVQVADSDITRVHVILLGGQSNAVGYGVKADLPKSPINFQGPQLTVDLYDRLYTDLSPRKVDPSFGSEITLGHSLAKSLTADTPERIAIVKYAVGGTNLYEQWKAGGDATTAGDGPLYQDFQVNAAEGLTALAAAYPGASIEIVAMLWIQGEADANRGYHEEYEGNLTTFIADIRETYRSDLPFFISRLSDSQFNVETSVPVQTVRAAQETIASMDDRAFLLDTDGFSVTFGDPIHFDAEGQQSIGYAAAAVMLPVLNFDQKLDVSSFDADANGDGLADGLAWLFGANIAEDQAVASQPVFSFGTNQVIVDLQSLSPDFRRQAWLAVEVSRDLGVLDPWASRRIMMPETSGTVDGVDFQITPNGSLQNVQITIPSNIFEGEGAFFFRFSAGLNP